MSEPWVTIVGLGEDGLSGLSDASRSALTDAEIIFGGPRHLELACAGPKGQPWPVPFSTAPVLAARGRKVVVLASGDPFWFGAGGSLMRDLAPGDWCSHPAPSCFALAANHLGWKLEETLCFGLHAAPFERLAPVLSTGVRVICTLRDGKRGSRPGTEWLAANGHAAARVHVMTRLGGPAQEVTVGATSDLTAQTGAGAHRSLRPSRPQIPGCRAPRGWRIRISPMTGRSPSARSAPLTLSALAPRPGELLWDIGGGSGSISAEWCLAAPGARAVTFEPRAERLENITENARRFGLGHRMTPVLGRAPDVLAGQPLPDVVFIGGGGRRDLLELPARTTCQLEHALWPMGSRWKPKPC